MVESPSAAGGPLGLCEGAVEIRIDVEAHHSRFPLNGVKMKIGGEILPGGQTQRRGSIARSCNGAGTMERTVDRARLLADVLHDIDFGTLGPTNGSDIVAKHPESGPHSLPFRNFDARFETAIGLAEKALGLEASRSVITRNAIGGIGVGFTQSSDDEDAALHLRILGSGGVGFK